MHMSNALTYYVKWWDWPCSEVVGIVDGFMINDRVGLFDTNTEIAGRWIPPSIRQQWAIATATWLWITPEEVWDYRVLAVTLMH
ncbi:hypothetical protein HRbin33_02443 [bacterium HR33]|nr:hypothetical protein HRbin33_02443 [bacterium HR33]